MKIVFFNSRQPSISWYYSRSIWWNLYADIGIKVIQCGFKNTISSFSVWHNPTKAMRLVCDLNPVYDRRDNNCHLGNCLLWMVYCVSPSVISNSVINSSMRELYRRCWLDDLMCHLWLDIPNRYVAHLCCSFIAITLPRCTMPISNIFGDTEYFQCHLLETLSVTSFKKHSIFSTSFSQWLISDI